MNSIPAESGVDRLHPVRGLITAHNVKGKRLRTADLERWTHLDRVVFECHKIDVFDARGVIRQDLFASADALAVSLSLRTDCTSPPDNLDSMKAAGLLDVFLAPHNGAPHFDAWLDACRGASVPVRLQVLPPFDADPGAMADRLKEAGVVAVNVALWDPLCPRPKRCKNPAETVKWMNALVKALEERETEANLLGLPFCQVDESLRSHAVNRRQFFLDHQQYQQDAHELAEKLYRIGPRRAAKAILILLGQHTSFDNPIDRKLLPWLLEHPWLRARVWAWHKLTRDSDRLRGTPRLVDPSLEEQEAEVERRQQDQQKARDTRCRDCALVRICDGPTKRLKRALPGVPIQAVEGKPAHLTLGLATAQRKHYDRIDADRITRLDAEENLVSEAKTIIERQQPDREIGPHEYQVDGEWCKQSAGGVRWFSFSNTEKLSTPLARVEPPFTVRMSVGSGIAEYAGFGLGRECRIVCPMVAYNHEIALHVAKNGRYVLLRDGAPVRPVEFVGQYYVPLRLGSLLEPRIAMFNIDGSIGTQGILLWEGVTNKPARNPADLSIVIVNTRYARRLQACLQSIAHQEFVDLERIEVVVAYVPGIDSTEDVLESFDTIFPELRIIRRAFAEDLVHSKGLLINESVELTSAPWVMLLDADTLIPPNMAKTILDREDDTRFLAPDGRVMLPSDLTAQILLGNIEPWRSWNELLGLGSELRLREAEGVPIGFCQCVRKSCFEQVRYVENHDFEGADWQFSQDMRVAFGPETRLSGIPVLHLDHGPSNWYGAKRHR